MPADTPANSRWSLRGVFDAALWVGYFGAAGLCLLTLAALAGDRHWLLELTTHFRPHYAAGLLACALIYAVARRPRSAVLFVAFSALNVVAVAPRFLPHDTPPVDAPVVKLLLANVLSDNHDHASLLALIQREKPDIIALLEVNDAWLADLSALASTHPHSRRIPRADNFGIALYGRLPLSDITTIFHTPAEVPSLYATFALGDRTVALTATHPLPPGDASNLLLRDLHLAAIARWSAKSPVPVIVLGDLNTTPWSPSFRALLRDGALHDTARGLASTWPVRPWWLRIPLDHCLVSDALTVVDHRVGPNIGSDHFPLIVTLALAPAAQ